MKRTLGQCEALVTEKLWQATVLDLARLGGWAAYHTHDSRHSAAGFPDLVLVHPGRRLVLWRELKTARGQLTKAQAAWLHALTLCGQDTAVWRPSDLDDVRRTLIPEAA